MSNSDPLLIFTPSGKRGHFPMGTSILEAARQIGVDLDSVCGGRGICSKCQIRPAFGQFDKHGVTSASESLSEWNAVEQRYKDKRGMIDGRRLGCQAKLQGDLVVDVPPESQLHKQVVRKRAELRDIELDSATRLYYVEVAEPDMHDPSGDLERLRNALSDQWNLVNASISTRLLGELQTVLRAGDWKVTCAIHQSSDNARPAIQQIWPGFYDEPVFGMAIDLGSTTIAAHLCNLQSGEVVASSGLMNPQIRFGEDLMSRVSYAMQNSGGHLEMTKVVREALNQLSVDVAAQASVTTDQIFEAVLVANPVMHHLLLGIDPTELGQAPFALAVSDALEMRAAEIDMSLQDEARLYILPCIAGHVGADAAAVALSEAPHHSDDLMLIVDVGTNAELLLGNKEKVLACSSPTGPAFEGAQISSGQRAAPGAIERVEIDPINKEPRFRVIGCELWSNDPGFSEAIKETGVTGICGSGIIEAVAEMRLAGLISADGLIGSAAQTGSSRCVPDGRVHNYLLFDGSAIDGPRIEVTQQDIRQIQLAKSALYAGARLLMDQLEVDHLDRVVLAGAFGAHISPKHALVLGMIPDCEIDKVTSAGNAAGTGARIALLNRTARGDVEQLVQKIIKIETALEPRFQEHFVAASHIPHMSAPYPILKSNVNIPEVNFSASQGNGPSGSRRRRRAGR